MRNLEDEKLIEGKSRTIDKPKAWRLSKQGRDLLGVTRHPVPLQSMKVDHYLAIAECMLELHEMGDLQEFRTELREPFELDGVELKYCPDAYFVWNGNAYVLEVQLSPCSSANWKYKWRTAEAFFSNGLEHASWQTDPEYLIEPDIVVVTNQMEDTVTEGTSLPVRVVRSIRELGE